MKNFISLGLLTALLTFGSALPSHAQVAPLPVTVDFANAHTFNGVGAQVWMGSKNITPVDQLLKDMNAKVVRASLTPSTPNEQLQAGMSLDQMYSIIMANDSLRQQQNFNDFIARMNTLGINVHQIIWANMPPQWLLIDETRPAGSNDRSVFALDEHMEDYANLITAQIKYGHSLGFRSAGVELTNEPQGAWGTRYTPEQYSLLVNLVRAKLDANGMTDVKLDGPGTGIRNWSEFRPALEASGALKNLNTITAHMYDPNEELVDPRTPGLTEFMGHGEDGPIMISEFGTKFTPGAEPGGEFDTPSFPRALRMSGALLQTLGLGAEMVSSWAIENAPNSVKDKDMALLDPVTLTPRPTGTAIKTMFGTVTPGSKTVAATGTDPVTLPIQAFLAPDNKTITLLIVNRTPSSNTLNVKFANTTLPRKLVSGTIYDGVTVTPVTQANRLEFGAAKVTKGALTVTVKPNTVNSVTLAIVQ